MSKTIFLLCTSFLFFSLESFAMNEEGEQRGTKRKREPQPMQSSKKHKPMLLKAATPKTPSNEIIETPPAKKGVNTDSQGVFKVPDLPPKRSLSKKTNGAAKQPQIRPGTPIKSPLGTMDTFIENPKKTSSPLEPKPGVRTCDLTGKDNPFEDLPPLPRNTLFTTLEEWLARKPRPSTKELSTINLFENLKDPLPRTREQCLYFPETSNQPNCYFFTKSHTQSPI